MISWAITNYSGMYAELEHWIAVFEHLSAGAKLNAIGHAKATGEVSLAWKQKLAVDVAGYAAQQSEILGLELSYQLALQLKRNLEANHRYSPELLLKELGTLKQTIIIESTKRKLAFISPPYDVYFEQDRLFGDEVYEKFEEARQEVKDTGNCLAVELSTAAVFHLMRVAEYGLRYLAKKVRPRIKLTDKGRPLPIEYADWDKVLTGIKNQITSARHLPKGARRQAQLDRWSSAGDHCEYMKDIWRNHVSHTRKPYKQTEAIGAYERVRDFMKFLASTLG